MRDGETVIWPGNVVAGEACEHGEPVRYAAIHDLIRGGFRWYRGVREGVADSMVDALAFARGER